MNSQIKHLNFRFFYLLFFIFSVVIAIVFIYISTKEIGKIEILAASDRVVHYLRATLEGEKNSALSLAVAIASNQGLVSALEDRNEDAGFEILSPLVANINTLGSDKLLAQIIADDLTVFTRSWDNSFTGMPLDLYREDLRKIVETKQQKAKVSIEVGRMLSLIATAPIRKNRKVIGYLEIIVLFDGLVRKFREIGAELIVLMDQKMLDKAVLMKQNPTVDEFVITNNNYNEKLLSRLSKEKWRTLKSERVIKDEKYVYLLEPIFNGEDMGVGYFLIIFDKELTRRYADALSGSAFWIGIGGRDIYDYVKHNDYGGKLYKSSYDRDILYLKDLVDPKDKEVFIAEARERLESYDKDELIDLILEHDGSKKIRGEIR